MATSEAHQPLTKAPLITLQTVQTVASIRNNQLYAVDNLACRLTHYLPGENLVCARSQKWAQGRYAHLSHISVFATTECINNN